MLIPDERVAEVVRLLTSVPGSLDSLDALESLMELEEQYGTETVRWAVRFIEASSGRSSRGWPGSSSGEADPLWDRELDP